MRNAFLLSFAASWFLSVLVCSAQKAEPEMPWGDPLGWALAPCEDLAELNDKELRVHFEKALSSRSGFEQDKALEFGIVLNEIGRRGGEEWSSYLKEILAKIRKNEIPDGLRKGTDGGSKWRCHDLDVLTVLRQMEGANQPK